jgi:phosphatidate phosphatase APP1
LRDFLERAGFPAGALHLKLAHLTDKTFLNFFKSGTETKPARIEPLLEAYTRHRFVLVGDSGEQDPEVYAGLLEKHPNRIARVYIRNVTGAARDDERFSRLFADVDPEKWRLFTDPVTLQDP